GGVFKQVLVDSGVGAEIAALSEAWHMPPLIFAWLATALLRVMIGSTTVAVITAAGIVGPLIDTTGASPELLVLAVGAGSVFGSHVNDSASWMFKEFFNLSMKQTFASWTVMETTISIVGLAGVLLLELGVGRYPEVASAREDGKARERRPALDEAVGSRSQATCEGA